MDKNDYAGQVWLAAVLLTRLPLPHLPPRAFSQGARAVWAYPVVGLGLGAAGAVTAYVALWAGLPVFIASVLALGAVMLLTGAMHEDGLADVFDGFWGGTTPARRLEIMRDSQIGTYGVLALLLVTLLRISALAVVLDSGWPVLLAAAALSRAMMPAVMHALPYARTDGLSRSVGRPDIVPVVAGLGIGGLIAFLSLGMIALMAILAAFLVGIILTAVARRKIGGQTGDVLGAVQQLSETAILLTCAVMV
ncbi:adenosylcobinamide-GDP ribazoletransferase [Sulfitobacter sp. F26169L]|uniref:adenosylcobinamide-GDP ribazoletransferase n=1 Tax=Sulfitobacter sp. F26169L TaxID=2996015 RepID=UPI00226104B6|nr:adenosylcobinamide-GDP ribazoletransferase [Sulfitobacter sp. F26169L]MCX7566392.1 adenosylcobinamide-GDP ribazoletransferase [Sulfitobacter sp. F26169L]